MKTLCWRCKNACYGCSWSKHFIPVKGWTAIATEIKNFDSITPSFHVIECPKFVSDKKLTRNEQAKLLGISERTLYRKQVKLKNLTKQKED